MVDRSRDISLQLPVAFLIKMAGLLGEEYDAFLSSLYQPPRIGLRVNTLKITSDQFSRFFPFKLSPLPWCPSGYVVEDALPDFGGMPPGKHPYHSSGLYYLQEPSAMAAAEALSPLPSEKVLDLAAAPGGKTTHIAALMQNSGLLVANEIHPERVWDLAENLERCGVTNAVVTNETPARLATRFAEFFDRVMLDAPCSGEGMFRKSERARREWKPELPASCARRQSSILEQAARLVKPGGCIAYTTCTFSPEENETVIFKFLDTHPEFDLKTVNMGPGISPGRPGWIGLSPDDKLNRTMRIWPHHSPGEGHFIAILVKNMSYEGTPEDNIPIPRLSAKKPVKSRDKMIAQTTLADFSRKNLHISYEDRDIELVGPYVYCLPERSPDTGELKVIHPGWWLGTVQKNRFIPSHSLAMGIKVEHAKQSVPLQLGDQLITAFLAGESFTYAGENGWVLVTVDGYPLGWGKRVQNVVKNYYPRGLRRRS